ncbi:COG4223 family protein [Phenylobacterium sp.]|uniref:COG4223 family protein n=1 Tax=Phenylobacterium sp. TaxID=1871053 RepID=UPI002B930D14|nr:mitofilin family membrane protein [Phenylobacterium sp.]HVI31617.1 mitofilin family membrane protein [Phenylobacterium sp.]
MTAPPEPADLSAPKDPAEYRRQPASGSARWAVIALGVVCVLAGAAVGVLAPRMLAARPAPPAAAEAPLAAEPALSAAAPPATPETSLATPAASSAEIERLTARIAALESQEKSTSRAAAAALAAAALVEATQGARPFSDELASLRAAAPALPELAALSRLAEVGAPTRAALAASFPDYAARAATASRAPGEGAGLSDRVGYALARVVSIRRVGEVTGEGVDARLARAERLVEDGDLDGALRVLDGLSPAAREALAPWRIRAERRAEIDRQAAALRARALRDLGLSARSGA